MVQWLRIHLTMQGKWVWCWGTKTPHAAGQLSLHITTAEPAHHNKSLCAATQDVRDATNIPCITNKTRGSQTNKQTYMHQNKCMCGKGPNFFLSTEYRLWCKKVLQQWRLQRRSSLWFLLTTASLFFSLGSLYLLIMVEVSLDILCPHSEFWGPCLYHYLDNFSSLA